MLRLDIKVIFYLFFFFTKLYSDIHFTWIHRTIYNYVSRVRSREFCNPRIWWHLAADSWTFGLEICNKMVFGIFLITLSCRGFWLVVLMDFFTRPMILKQILKDLLSSLFWWDMLEMTLKGISLLHSGVKIHQIFIVSTNNNSNKRYSCSFIIRA